MASWREKSVKLERATVVIFEGPGAEWVCILRGTRERGQRRAKGARRPSPIRRREGRA